MGIEFTEARPSQVPTDKKIVIAGVEVGDCTPRLTGVHLVWHACIHIGQPLQMHSWLVQGHGVTPSAAVANGVAKARLQREAFAAALARLESELGTTDTPSEKLTTYDCW